MRRCGKAMKRNCGKDAKSAERRKDAASTYVLRPRFQIRVPNFEREKDLAILRRMPEKRIDCRG